MNDKLTDKSIEQSKVEVIETTDSDETKRLKVKVNSLNEQLNIMIDSTCELVKENEMLKTDIETLTKMGVK